MYSSENASFALSHGGIGKINEHSPYTMAKRIGKQRRGG